MRYLIVADIHSNLEAFQSVIEDAEKRGGFDKVWSLGDVVGYGPDPGECVDLMREYDTIGVVGNHDLAAIGRLSIESFNIYGTAAARWTTTQLAEEQAAYLRGLSLRIELEDITVVHGSPRDPVWEYVLSPTAAKVSFLHFDTPTCFLGHSHIPFVCRASEDDIVFNKLPLNEAVALGNDRLIINPGSLGQPRDSDPRASYAIYASDEGAVYHHRAEYDIANTQKKMSERGLPTYLIDRLAHGR